MFLTPSVLCISNRCPNIYLENLQKPARLCKALSEEIDQEISGLRHLSEAAKQRALDKKANKFEKVKVAKCGSRMWTEVFELAQLVREGKTTWEDLALDDIDIRMKWAGLFHRRKRHPGTFMMRLKVANGELTSVQLRMLAECIRPYGSSGCADITTRANIQLRGVTLESADIVMDALHSVGITSFQTGMDNVRNITGNPIAGIDPHELIDTRPICTDIQNMITRNNAGNPELANLPRKLNICVSSTRDDFPHSHINDVAFEAVKHPVTGDLRFNVGVGGYFSIKRNTTSISMDTSISLEQIVLFSEALLKVFRDHGPRGDRQKTRLMWLIEEIGIDKFRDLISEQMGNVPLERAVHLKYESEWERRDLLGVHEQKQEGYYFACCRVPVGRLQAVDFEEAATISEKYGDGTIRLTCDFDIIFPNIKKENIESLTMESFFRKFRLNPGPLERNLVSCTGSQFCGLALIETKNRAMRIIERLEAELVIPKTVRIHWTGCPNSCGQAQVGEIGLMGAPAKLDGKAVEGVKIFLGGKIGENPKLAEEFETGIPVQEEILVPKLKELLINEFGARPKDVPSQLEDRPNTWWRA